MSAILHQLSPIEIERSTWLSEWLARYPGETSAATMASRLRAVQRTCEQVEVDQPVNLEAFPWELFDDREVMGAARDLLLQRYGREHASPYIMAMRALLTFLVSRRVCSRESA